MGLLQRSCQACVKARRRCSLATPCCKRCSVKRIPCRYNDAPGHASTDVQGTSHGSVIKARMITRKHYDEDLSRQIAQGNLDTRLQLFIRQVLGDGHYQGSRPPLPSSALSGLQDRGATRKTSGNGLQMFNPLHLEIIRVFGETTLQQLSDILRSFPSQFAQRGSTPSIHSSLYGSELPLPLKEVRDICYSYFVGGEYLASNRLDALRLTIRRLLRLSRHASTFADKVAYAQAVALAQIIRLLECHDMMDETAESDNEQMWALTHQLWQHAPTQLSGNLSPWKAWLFSENVRRTIIVCNILLAVYSSLRRGYAIHPLCIEALPFDARVGLWEVNDENSWNTIAAKTPGPFLVTLRQFANFQQPTHGGGQFENLFMLWYGG